MNILDTFIGVLLAFIVKDGYDIFIQKYVKLAFFKYKDIFKGKTTIDKEISKMVKEGKLILVRTKLKGENKK